MIAVLIPGLVTRVNSESKNKNVTISILYNDIYNKVTEKTVNEFLYSCQKAGIDTVSFMEDDLNALVARGDVTSIKYNVLRHKYDDESIRIADTIAKNCPDVSYDSHIILAKKDKTKNKLKKMIPAKFNSSSVAYLENIEGMDVYVFYDGRKQLWDFAFGYDEELIDSVAKKGFNISLIFKVKNYDKQDYIKNMDKLIKKHNIEYINLKEDAYTVSDKDIIKENYKGLANLIKDNNMTLVVTENSSQLSNQKFMGYSDVFNSVMSKNGTKKVIRSYETYDDSHSVGLDYSYRVSQFFNSTIDRNIRFITVTQMVLDEIPFDECADYTVEAAKTYKKLIEEAGYTVGSATPAYNYHVNKTLNHAACAVIMVMFALIICQNVLGLKKFYIAVIGIAIAAIAFGATFVLPDSLVNLYPTAYSAIMSCFAMTLILTFIKTKSSDMKLWTLILSTFALTVVSLLITSVGMGVMLSGVDYYINNDIFRGIKISLLVPLAFTAVSYYLMFMRTEKTQLIKTTSKILRSEIKVYWVIIAGLLGIIGMKYIVRSGNVNSISMIEQTLRNTVTEIFQERPRTKEFLIGYPALLLFVYYSKCYNLKLINWILAVGASILTASITNSFCHVFTDYTTIVMRVVNGLIAGLFVCVIAYFANLILIKIAETIKKKI